QARCDQLEQELAGLRQTREELNARCTKEQAASAESARRLKELEERLSQRPAETEKDKTELENRTSEHGKIESNLRKQLEAAPAAAPQPYTTHFRSQARCDQLEQELAGLRQAHEELNSRSTKEQAASAESARRLKELEERLS